MFKEYTGSGAGCKVVWTTLFTFLHDTATVLIIEVGV